MAFPSHPHLALAAERSNRRRRGEAPAALAPPPPHQPWRSPLASSPALASFDFERREDTGCSPVSHGGRLRSSVFFPTIETGLVNRLGFYKIFSETNNATAPWNSSVQILWKRLIMCILLPWSGVI